jgi:hypothetical protein
MLHTDAQTGSTLEEHNGFFILHLYGTPFERGAAHGRLLREKIQESNVSRYYGNFLYDLYMSSDFAQKMPLFLRRPVAAILENFFYSPLEKMILTETREELEGLAEEASIDPTEALRGILAGDIMEQLAAGFLKSGREALGNYYLGGCSAAYVRRSGVKPHAHSLFARNMDFPGIFNWKYPVIVFHHPEEEIAILAEQEQGGFRWQRKQKQPYMYISTAGFPGTGLTGMNASGIAMGTFACVSKNCSSRKMVFLDYNHYLFTRTESMGGIKKIIEEENLCSASPHVVMFADKDEAITVEVDSKNSVVVSMPNHFDLHVQTNHFVNPLLKKRELEFPLEREFTVGRYRLMKEVIEGNYGKIDVQAMINIIASNIDLASKEPRLLGDFPAQCNTLHSVVFEPETYNFWVASGRPPAVCYNRYYGYNLLDELSGEKKRKLPSYKKDGKLSAGDGARGEVTKDMQASLVHIALSQELLNKGRVSRALTQLEEALRHYDDPGYQYVRGLVYMIAAQPQQALPIISTTRQTYIFAPLKDIALSLWEARCLDILGRREEAVALYQDTLKSGILVANLRDALQQGIHTPFTQEDMPKTVDYFVMGPLEF